MLKIVIFVIFILVLLFTFKKRESFVDQYAINDCIKMKNIELGQSFSYQQYEDAKRECQQLA